MEGSVPAASGQSGGKSPESVTRDAEVKCLMRWDGYEARQTCSQFCISSISALWSDVNRKPVKRGADWCNLDQTFLFEIRLELQRSDPFETVRPRKIKTLQRSRFRVLFCVCVEQSQWKTSQVYLINRGSPGATDPSDLTWIGRQGSVLRRQSDRQRRSGHVFHNCERLDDDVLSLPFSASKWSNGIHTKVTQHILNLLVSDVL